MKKGEKGITLIALIVIIVVLLILAGISMGLVKDKKGIINQTKTNVSNAQRESIIEKIEADLYNEKVKKGEIPLKERLKEIITDSYGVVDKEGESEIDSFTTKEGGYQIQFSEIQGWKVNISEYIKVGDYVNYEPTKRDVNKTLDVNPEKLKYISPLGGYSETLGKMTHGNGNSEQTFTAKANNQLKWRVLEISCNRVKLISDNVVQTDSGSNFILQGGIGYLYAEQELNEVCKIYGYGYGADTESEVTYIVGGPKDTPIKGKIRGTGARSITIDDLNKLANITEADFKTLDANYGSNTIQKEPIYYPTLSTNNTESIDRKKGFKHSSYNWNKIKIEDINVQNMIFTGTYWLASRAINISSYQGSFSVRTVLNSDNKTSSSHLCNCGDTGVNHRASTNYAVRPVVTLKVDVIDVLNPTVDTNNVTTWKLK